MSNLRKMIKTAAWHNTIRNSTFSVGIKKFLVLFNLNQRQNCAKPLRNSWFSKEVVLPQNSIKIVLLLSRLFLPPTKTLVIKMKINSNKEWSNCVSNTKSKNVSVKFKKKFMQNKKQKHILSVLLKLQRSQNCPKRTCLLEE